MIRVEEPVMSKHFQSKKETVSFINKNYNDSLSRNSLQERLYDLEEKFKTLSERTKKLEKVYQFHKGIIQNISSGILTIDSSEKITFINTAALRVLDYEFNDIIGMSLRKIFADPDEAHYIIAELLEHKRMFESKEVNLLTRLQKVIPIGFTTTVLTQDGNGHEGVIISFRDLTNVHNFRLRMERIDRLATLGEVSAGIAHEIRNPLAGIKTSAQVLEESYSPGDPRSQLVARIVKEIDRSNELLKKFFKFAKPGRPRQDFIPVETIINGVFILLASKMKKKGIRFKTDFNSDLPRIYVDENQIEQVLINLFLNAIDAMPEGGEITVRTDLEQEKCTVKDGDESCVKVDIVDTGYGIAAENLEKIFNPFFTTKSDGVGLGLSITSRLVEENGGQIHVSSVMGKGSIFTLLLPIT
jgi:PAS domain S-box-containing protein